LAFGALSSSSSSGAVLVCRRLDMVVICIGDAAAANGRAAQDHHQRDPAAAPTALPAAWLCWVLVWVGVRNRNHHSTLLISKAKYFGEVPGKGSWKVKVSGPPGAYDAFFNPFE
jgi:hypothetical protein